MACFIYMFVSPLFQCSYMCLLEVKKIKFQIQSDVAAFEERSSDRAVQRRPWASKTLSLTCSMWMDDRVLNVSAFPLPSHLSLGKTVLKTLTGVAVLFSRACCFCCLPWLWPAEAAAVGWTWGDRWLVTSPRAAVGALLCPGTTAAFGELETHHLQQIHLDGQY